MNYMQEALRLAELGRYSVVPNPMVGCIIERDGEVVGRGWHQKAGSDHAEVIALKEAGVKAVGANVYVTLEPCCHFGRTPPCVDALIAAKVRTVNIALLDSNPVVNGKGAAKLREAGVEVNVGLEAEAASKQNEVFLRYATTKKPYVVVKWAMTADGKIASDSGDAKWITGVKARTHVHYTRSWLGAVLVGANTVLLDNPKLTPHLLAEKNIKYPWRIVLDGKGSSPLTAEIFADTNIAKTLVATTESSSLSWREELLAKGVDVLVLPSDYDGKIDLNLLLNELGKKEITGLLVEGGQEVLTGFIKNGLVDRVHLYIAPKLIGGAKNLSPLGNLDLATMNQAFNLKYESFQFLDNDIFLNLCLPE